MRVTVEGVETAAQATFLDNVAGDQLQGFFFGRPMPAIDVGAYIIAEFSKTHVTPSSALTAPGNQHLVKSG
jgi:EAL domain-containing protein (putative c-di-GMP-specific phosphodiesterase class I)